MSNLYSSSRGYVFMEMLFVIIAFAWIITIYARRLCAQGRPYVDILGPAVAPAPVVPAVSPPTYGVPPATQMVIGSEANIRGGQHYPASHGYPGQGYRPTFIDLILEGYEQLLLDYLPFFIMGVLNLVAFRCKAFCLVNLFIVLIHVLLFNILRYPRCPIPWMIAIFKFSWAGWVMAWFINFWATNKLR